ncbi:MAG: hypothetical protein ABFS12_18030 [Bacteroidota bacterium]
MKTFMSIIIIITTSILYNNLYSQKIHQKLKNPIKKGEISIQKKKPKRNTPSKIINPRKKKEIICKKNKRRIHHQNPPQRPSRRYDHAKVRKPNIKHKNNNPVRNNICGVIKEDSDLFFVDNFELDEVDFQYEEKHLYYHLEIKLIKGREFTDNDFPIAIKKIELEYIGTQWLNSDDFPVNMKYKSPGEYIICRINLNIYVFEKNYRDPFAINITFKDNSNEIVVFNYDGNSLNSGNEYLFHEEIPLKKTGYAWVTLGFFDIEYNQFYSAAFSPYLTMRKIYIPGEAKELL